MQHRRGSPWPMVACGIGFGLGRKGISMTGKWCPRAWLYVCGGLLMAGCGLDVVSLISIPARDTDGSTTDLGGDTGTTSDPVSEDSSDDAMDDGGAETTGEDAQDGADSNPDGTDDGSTDGGVDPPEGSEPPDVPEVPEVPETSPPEVPDPPDPGV